MYLPHVGVTVTMLPHELTLTSYQREKEGVVAVFTVPVDGQGDAVFVVRGDPSLEGDVGGPQARVIPVSALKHLLVETNQTKLLP